MRVFIIIVFMISMLLDVTKSFASDNFSELLKAWVLAQEKYESCMEMTAETYSKTDSTPYEIATATQSKCSLEFSKCETTSILLEVFINLENRHKYGLSEKEAKATAIEEAKSSMRHLKDELRGKVVQWVIENRLSKEKK